jgi:HlyD family secretion protein
MSGTRIGLKLAWLSGLAVLALVSVAGWYTFAREKPAADKHATGAPASSAAIPVEVVTPLSGGLDRVCVQPGTVEPFESADLHAKVSGYLAEQKVDIGDRVQKGDVLARISVPEIEAQVKQDRAEVARAEAKADQMTAAVTTAEADLGTATVGVAFARAEARSKESYRAYREKQRNRFKELAASTAIDPKLAEEQEDQYQAAVSAELAAGESVNAAKQKEVAAGARVKQAQADLKYATAEVAVAKARLERSEVLLGYTVIKSPYTGVVTKRSFHPGEFVRSAEAGERTPIFVVERTDVMRIVVQVPDRDVPFVDVGDAAGVTVDALPGVTFKTVGAEKAVVSRIAASEDSHTRMMRIEIHVGNPNGKLRRGMFGRVTLALQVGAPEAVRIPSSALHGKAEGGRASVRVVRDDIAHVVPVRYGTDNGSEVEILSGLTPADRVIVRASGPVDNGTQVAATTGSRAKSGH